MPTEIPTFSEHVLNAFAQKVTKKAIRFLMRSPGLDEADSQDVVQESFMILWENNRAGKLKDMTSSLYTYFLGICKNKAKERLRARDKTPQSDSDSALDTIDAVRPDKITTLLTLDPDQSLIEQKEAITRQIVHDLPEPCEQILWGFYRDNLSLKALGDLLGRTADSLKVTKHRCQEKFRTRWKQLADSLFK